MAPSPGAPFGAATLLVIPIVWPFAVPIAIVGIIVIVVAIAVVVSTVPPLVTPRHGWHDSGDALVVPFTRRRADRTEPRETIVKNKVKVLLDLKLGDNGERGKATTQQVIGFLNNPIVGRRVRQLKPCKPNLSK